MMPRATLRVRGLVHNVVGFVENASRCLLGCGGYVDNSMPESPEAMLTCLACLTHANKLAEFREWLRSPDGNDVLEKILNAKPTQA